MDRRLSAWLVAVALAPLSARSLKAQTDVDHAQPWCDRPVIYQRGNYPAARDAGTLLYQRGMAAEPAPRPTVQYVGQPDEACSCGESCHGGCMVEPWGFGPACPELGAWLDGIAAYGWLEQGFTWNSDSPNNRFNTPLTFNDRSNEYQMNQLYAVLERSVCTESCVWDIGGRVDLLYGTDYFFTTARGLETHRDGSPRWNSDDGPRGGGAALYGLAMPQLYAEIAAPVADRLSVKLGHFYTILGYEAVMAPQNFFYSHSYTKQYGEPFTHTGLLASMALTNCLAIQAGMTRGWDTWEDPNDDLGLLTGLSWTCPDGCTSLAFALHAGDEDQLGRNNRTLYSIVLEQRITPCLIYVLQHDLGIEANAETNREIQQDNAKWYSIVQYLYYTASPTLAAGMRVEWFRDQDNARVLGVPLETLVEGGDYVELSLGLNWQPWAHVTLRPELRWDHSNVEAQALQIDGMFDDFSDKDQITFATDLILVY